MNTLRCKSPVGGVHLLVVLCAILGLSCASIPEKKFFVLNYIPSTFSQRISDAPYPVTIRLRQFDIEEAYSRPQIVYRQNPFELQYYYYKVWAVKPNNMVTDLVYQHLVSSRLVSHVVKRFDEGYAPDYELSGTIEALEEYDSDDLWFAHLALRLSLTRVSDGAVVYSRRFDHRKRVFQHQPEFVIRELSSILEYIMDQALTDLDKALSGATSATR